MFRLADAQWRLSTRVGMPISTEMEMSEPPVTAQRLSDRTFDALAIGMVFLAYLIVFAAVREQSSTQSIVVSSLINLAPLIVLTAAVRPLIRRHLINASLTKLVIGHAVLAVLFTFLWHWMLLILVGIRSGGSLVEFTVQAFFPEPALAWQLLQGLTVYALIAAVTYARNRPVLPDQGLNSADLPEYAGTGSAEWEEQEPSLKRYFIRRGEDIQPIDVSDIISIAGADDYAEVTTMEGQHLVRTTLAKFEASLDAAQFLRIHRSRIVNLQQVERVEAAGDGRMLLHMSNGEQIQTSRAGAKAMRNQII